MSADIPPDQRSPTKKRTCQQTSHTNQGEVVEAAYLWTSHSATTTPPDVPLCTEHTAQWRARSEQDGQHPQRIHSIHLD
ncbi:hypothetical protein [Parafrankia discariae]|uniref:hypothetical protein n=1 Tax=Parafrankia discariae TaxID=365528 RepID=UPI000382B27F|nr:hypothetical protein [Parafrankia discariae]